MTTKKTVQKPGHSGHYKPHWFEKVSSEGMAFLGVASEQKKQDDGYARTLCLVPDGSPLLPVIDAFYHHTPVALDLPFWSFLWFVSAWLAQEGVAIEVGGQRVSPELWLVLLARSGGYKTFSADIVKKYAPVKDNISGIESDAKLIEILADLEGKGERPRWIDDEFAQTLKKIEQDGSPMSGCKKYLLQMYDGGKIQRKTKAYEMAVEKTKTSILGINVYETFLKVISPESLADGFGQRFDYVVASDPMREPQPRNSKSGRYVEIDRAHLESVTKKAWEAITAQPLLKDYRLAPAAKETFQEASDLFAEKYADVPASFFIRIRWRLFAYALVYHILRGKGAEAEIDTTDARYAVLLFRQSLGYISEIFTDIDSGETMYKIDRVRILFAKHEATQEAKKPHERKPFSTRDIVIGMRAQKVKTSEAAKLYEIVFGKPYEGR